MAAFRPAAGVLVAPAVADIIITVLGLPAPQGSKKGFRNQHTGKIHMVESSAKVKPWRSDVKAAAIRVTEDFEGWTPMAGPLEVSMVFTFMRPKGHWRTGRNAGLLKDSAPGFPRSKPDLSKLARSTEDALTGVVWVDDAQVVSYRRLMKCYAGTEQVDALQAQPGCIIRVWALDQIDHPPLSIKPPPPHSTFVPALGPGPGHSGGSR